MSLQRDARYLAAYTRWLASQGRLVLEADDPEGEDVAWEYVCEGARQEDEESAPKWAVS